MIHVASTVRGGLRRSSVAVRSRFTAPTASMNSLASLDDDDSNERVVGSACSIVNTGDGLSKMHLHYSSSNFSNSLPSVCQKRFMSNTTNIDDSATTTATTEPTFDETMDKLFHDEQKPAEGSGDEWFIDPSAATPDGVFEPTWYNLTDHAVTAVNTMHEMTGLPYAGSIIATTLAIRVCIFPVALHAQRASSRMAHLQPELQILKKRFEALGTPTRAEQQAFTEQMRALLTRYGVHPLSALWAPIIQAPIFISMFFGMKKMPTLFPTDFSTGGILWFTDLTVPDPTYVLPITCAVTFLATIESGKQQMIDGNPNYGPTIVNTFRAMAIVMAPVMSTFPSAMLCYWVPNNLMTLIQSSLFQNKIIRSQLGIWERPKPVPGSTPNMDLKETMENMVKKVRGEATTESEKIQQHNDEVDARKRVSEMSKNARARRRAGSVSKKQRRNR